MARTALKLKDAPAELPPLREPLRAALDRVAESKQAIAENASEQDAARQQIREAEATIKEAEEALAAAPALQRRALRAALQSAQDNLTDWTDHLGELRKKATEGFSSLQNKLQYAADDVKAERAKLLQGHPRTVALLQRLGELRSEQNQVAADLRAIASAGGIPKGSENWESPALTALPAPDAALVSWINELATNAAVELAE